MKLLRWLLATLFLSPLSMAVPFDPMAPPSSYDKVSGSYRFVQSSIFDIDDMLRNLGINVYACRLDNGSAISHPGVGACLYDSARYTFKEKRASKIWVWVLNEQNQYLPPLILEWKNTHTGWFKFGGEFLFLSFENILGQITKKANRVVSQQGASTCTTMTPADQDLGNFIGDLTITVPKGRKVSEYFVLKNVDGLDAEKILIHASTPYYLNKKRAYKIKATVLNGQQEGIEISMLTNYNLISRREACFKGSLEPKPGVPNNGEFVP